MRAIDFWVGVPLTFLLTVVQRIRRVIHATFIKPYGHLFWADEQGWHLYLPNITVEDIRDRDQTAGE